MPDVVWMSGDGSVGSAVTPAIVSTGPGHPGSPSRIAAYADRVNPYADLARPPLHVGDLRRALVVPGGLWTGVDVVAETGSTNADVAGRARGGAPEGDVLLAERQVAGRGRLGRVWESPSRAGIACSVLLRPGAADPGRGWEPVGPGRYGWLPLLAGVALADAVRRLGEVEATLKWPNDLLVVGRKVAGILAEVADGAVVVGMGVNVSLRTDEQPRTDATSLLLAGSSCVDRAPIVKATLRALADRYTRWRATGGDADASGLRAEYRLLCGTLNRQIRVQLPGGGELHGTAVDVDAAGRLLVADGAEVVPVAAGDVVHIR